MSSMPVNPATTSTMVAVTATHNVHPGGRNRHPAKRPRAGRWPSNTASGSIRSSVSCRRTASLNLSLRGSTVTQLARWKPATCFAQPLLIGPSGGPQAEGGDHLQNPTDESPSSHKRDQHDRRQDWVRTQQQQAKNEADRPEYASPPPRPTDGVEDPNHAQANTDRSHDPQGRGGYENACPHRVAHQHEPGHDAQHAAHELPAQVPGIDEQTRQIKDATNQPVHAKEDHEGDDCRGGISEQEE